MRIVVNWNYELESYGSGELVNLYPIDLVNESGMVEDSTTVDQRGVITERGKFEREPLYVWFAWNVWVMQGFGDEITDGVNTYSVFDIDEDMVVNFPELVDYKNTALVIWNDEQGFVNHMIMNEEQYSEFEDRCETQANEIEDE